MIYKVKYNRVNESIFTGLKYAEISFADDWTDKPIKVLYGLTWNHVSARVSKWMKQHQYDVPIDWYAPQYNILILWK